jgi:hypothetical protein
MRVLKETTSVCPECTREGKLNVIPARVVESDGKILYQKECEKHGKFEDVYWSDSELYERAEKYKWDGKGPVNPRIVKEHYKCPFDCVGPLTGLCGYHLTRTCLGIVDVTNRCNLRCPTCFANAGAVDYVYEPTMEQLERAFKAIKGDAGAAVQLTGGEPTVRDDLPEIAEKAREYFSHVEVNTNSIRLAREKDFVRDLIPVTFYVSYDTETDPGVYDQFRGHGIYDPDTKRRKVESMTGQDLIDIKKQAIDNVEKADGRVVLVPTIGMNNIDQVWKIIEFAIERGEVIRGVNFQPISFGGRGSKKIRATIPDLINRISEESGFIGREDWYPVPSVAPLFDIAEYYAQRPLPAFTVHPHCGAATILVETDGDWLPLPQMIDVDKLYEAITNIVDMLPAEGEVGTVGKLKMLREYRKFKQSLEESHPFIRDAIEGIMERKSYDSLKDLFGNKRILFLGSMHFQDPGNIDFERTRRCGIHQAYPDGSLMSFCIVNSGIVTPSGMTTREAKLRQFGISWEEYLSRSGLEIGAEEPLREITSAPKGS